MDSPSRPDYASAMQADHTLDARGLLCPLPVLKLRKRLGALGEGDVLELWSDDPAAVVDVPHFCAEAGQELVAMDNRDGYVAFRVRKRARP
ncbi:MAG: sulfurtransferase TusA family protein [Roseovarius sp.]